MDWLHITSALILGLTSSLHCLGMCGPIAMAIPVKRTSNASILFGALQYNSGRAITYAGLGAIVGSFGLTLNTIGVLQWLSIIAGVILIIVAWRKYLERFFVNWLPTVSISMRLNKLLGKVIRSKSPAKLFLLGGLNGLLPCGMVFAALLISILTGDIIQGSLTMAAFGVGTFPAMIAMTFVAGKMSSTLRQRFSRVVPYMLTIVGALVMLRGMNLDIPFISPKVEIAKSVDKEDNKTDTQEDESCVEMSCCHK